MFGILKPLSEINASYSRQNGRPAACAFLTWIELVSDKDILAKTCAYNKHPSLLTEPSVSCLQVFGSNSCWPSKPPVILMGSGLQDDVGIQIPQRCFLDVCQCLCTHYVDVDYPH